MAILISNIDSLVTVDSLHSRCKSGDEMQSIGEIRNGAIIFEDKILWVGRSDEVNNAIKDNDIIITEKYDANGYTILPGFVDSHTHITFAGNRSDEFARRLRGATYQEIAAGGGGILTTMRATRQASVDELYENGRKLAISAIEHGTTAIEVKSGYGFTTESELNQLKAIKKLAEELPIHFTATFLGAHDFPPEYHNNREKYIDLICEEMLPAVASEGLAEFCDAFVDKGYYTLKQGEKILRAALDLGFKLKVHCDELADFGAAALAASLGAISADHLLFISDNGIDALKSAGTIATLLPGTAYFIRMPYAPARRIIEKGVPVALSTDCNPGSCFTENMQLILSLAVINMNMTAEEAIVAATLNGAAAIDKSASIGSLEPGKSADFVIYDTTSYTDIFYHFGINQVREVWCKGKRIVSA